MIIQIKSINTGITMDCTTERTQTRSDTSMRAKEERRPYEGVLGDTSELRIIEHLMSLPGFDFNITEIARSARISRPAADKVVKKFARWGVVKVLRKRGNMTFYKLNEDSPIVNSIAAFNDMLTMEMYPELKKALRSKRNRKPQEASLRRRIESRAESGFVSGIADRHRGPAAVLASANGSDRGSPIASGAHRGRSTSV